MTERQVTLLRLLVNERRLTRDEVRRCLVRRASRMQINQFSIERRQLDRWLNGEVKRLPHPSACRVLEAEFGHPPEKLLAFVDTAGDTTAAGSDLPDRLTGMTGLTGLTGPAGAAGQPADVPELVTTAAAQSARWGRWQDSLGLSGLAMEGLRIQLQNLATDYVHRPMGPVVRDLVALRDSLFEQLAAPDPAQLRELYLLTGTTCAILGHASGNLGFLGAAQDQIQTALICAQKAGYPGLSAWAIGVRALQSEWNGRPRDTLSLVARALKELERQRTVTATTVWLSAVEARGWARLGHRDAATEALAAMTEGADRLPSNDELDTVGGILTFPQAKQHFYAAVVSRRCGDLTRAEQYATSAIRGYVTGPPVQRSYGDETLAWAELAVTRATGRRPDLDGATEALRQVRDLAPHTRVAALVGPLQELGVLLSMPPLRTAVLAAPLREQVRQLLAPYRLPLGQARQAAAPGGVTLGTGWTR